MEIENLEHGPLTLLSPEEAKAMLDRGEGALIDVRNADEFAKAHIEGSALHPLRELDPAALETGDKQIVLLCAVGIRSRAAAEAILLAGRGPVAHIEGGLKAWWEAGLPVKLG